MIELGQMQKLLVIKEESFGVYVGETLDAGYDERVLLPKKQVLENCKVGDELLVFIYRDSQDRMIATMARPKVLLHTVAKLNVRQVNRVGAFLDWGLEKDLLLPYHEQTRKVVAGEQVLAALYVDKSGRLAATMKIYPYLQQDSPYVIGDTVTGTVYQVAPNFGVFVAVDGKYSGMIPRREAPEGYAPGDVVELRVTNVKEDGKLDLSAHKKAYQQMDEDAEAVFEKIHEDFEGELPFDDKADPEKIREVFGLSKAAFKRAVGRLYRERKIRFEDGRIIEC